MLSNANKLQGTPFGINRDYPREIINARKTLLKEKKDLKAKYPNANISIHYPAKLMCDKRVVKDMFPNWFSVMKGDRLDSNLGRDTSESFQQNDEGGEVFDTESEYSDDGGINNVDMADSSAVAQGRGSEPLPPALPKTPPPSLSMGPSLADGYLAMNERETAERAKQVECSDGVDHTHGTNSTENNPSTSTSRPPDQQPTA